MSTPKIANQWSIQQTPVISSSVNDESSYPNTNQMNVQYEKSSKTVPADQSSQYSSSVLSNLSSNFQRSTEEQQSYTSSEFDRVADDITLNKYGYTIIKKIEKTMHGCIYEGKMMDNNVDHIEIKKVEIKQDDNSCENIKKEAEILKYLSFFNKSPANNIYDFIDFLQTETDYYLISSSDRSHSQTLNAFIRTAHAYILQNKLRLKAWRTCVKFIFWQITVLLYWMHNNMNVCHLNLNTDNIIIEHVKFISYKPDESDATETIVIETKGLNVKLINFSQAEIFAFDDNQSFLCSKKSNYKYNCPQQFNGYVFNAIKSDCYSLGILLYEMLIGRKPYKYPSETDEGYMAFQTQKFEKYLQKNGLSKHASKITVSLIEGLINIDQYERMDTTKIVNHDWLTHYANRYKKRIQAKTQSQYHRHQSQKKKLYQNLPFYSLKKNNLNKKYCTL